MPITQSITFLQSLIRTPSFSKEEAQTAGLLASFLKEKTGETCHRQGNNVWIFNKNYSDEKPTILLNSHHDTVHPNPAYIRDPFSPDIEDEKLYGLGSNDAGGCLVSLLFTFLHFYQADNLKYNLCFAATAEEEISGEGGLESILSRLGDLDFAIVGEPTLMNMAIAERGLMVLDCVAEGKAGHAARNEGVNAIYQAVEDIQWFRQFEFEKVSKLFGPISMNVTIINAGTQHNVVPAHCHYTVDIRVTDAYKNQEVLDIVRSHVSSTVTPRSTRLKPSSISEDHPIILAGKAIGRKTYGSPTTSDQAVLDIPSLKMGPGDSARSHMADEYIYLKEITSGIELYKRILSEIVL